MSKLLNRLNRAALAYQTAEKEWSAGHLKRAFQLFLAAAKGGYVPAFNLVAHFYERGKGVRANDQLALHWYELAYRSTSSWSRGAMGISATNIGCIWRDRNGSNERSNSEMATQILTLQKFTFATQRTKRKCFDIFTIPSGHPT